MSVLTRKNPQDATRRNVQAANKRYALTEQRLKKLEIGFHDAWAIKARVALLELQVENLQGQLKAARKAGR